MSGPVDDFEGKRIRKDILNKASRARSLNPALAAAIDRIEIAGSKPTNPKDAVGIRKVPLSTISAAVEAEIGLGMLEGACKYGRHNYRAIGVRASVYYDATRRHIMQWWEGEDIDPDSGLSHVTKAICSLVVLRDAMIQDKFTDDRPPKSKVDWVDLNQRAANIVDKYPNPKPAYTEKE